MTMQTQDIFKNFGSNWKWASLTVGGTARIHTEQPKLGADGVVFYNASDFVTSRCEAFDSNVPATASIWERTDFTNGPSYSTDRFGSSVCLPPARPVPMAPAPQAVRITTDEAESGGLWAYARRDENYVSVNTYGVVWFNLFLNGPEPRRSYSVEVTGVTHPIERSRAMPAPVAPPEAGKPFAPAPSVQQCVPPLPAPYPVAQQPMTPAPRTPWSPCPVPLDFPLNAEQVFFEKHAMSVLGDHDSVPDFAKCWYGEDGYSDGRYQRVGIRMAWMMWLERALIDFESEHGNMRYTHVDANEDTPDSGDDHGWADGVAELESAFTKAKAHANYLLGSYDALGHQALLPSQYMAIFGELPQ